MRSLILKKQTRDQFFISILTSNETFSRNDVNFFELIFGWLFIEGTLYDVVMANVDEI